MPSKVWSPSPQPCLISWRIPLRKYLSLPHLLYLLYLLYHTISTISWGPQTFLCSRLCNYFKDNHTYTCNMITNNYPRIHGFRPEHLTFKFWPADLFCLIRWTDNHNSTSYMNKKIFFQPLIFT